jgi:hypothetical protein
MPVESWREWCRDRADILDTLPAYLNCEFLARGFDYPSTAEANEATAPEIAAHSPSDNSKTTISDAPLFSGRAAACADRSDRNGPEVVLLLRRRAWRSAAQARVGAASGKRVLPD